MPGTLRRGIEAWKKLKRRRMYEEKSLVAFLFLVAVGLVFSGCCQILGSMKSGPADPCQPYEGCFSKDDCKLVPCVERDGCFFL